MSECERDVALFADAPADAITVTISRRTSFAVGHSVYSAVSLSRNTVTELWTQDATVHYAHRRQTVTTRKTSREVAPTTLA